MKTIQELTRDLFYKFGYSTSDFQWNLEEHKWRDIALYVQSIIRKETFNIRKEEKEKIINKIENYNTTPNSHVGRFIKSIRNYLTEEYEMTQAMRENSPYELPFKKAKEQMERIDRLIWISAEGFPYEYYYDIPQYIDEVIEALQSISKMMRHDFPKNDSKT